LKKRASYTNSYDRIGFMTKKDKMDKLQSEIDALETQVSDTKYFIDNSLCLETKKIYESALREYSSKLNKLYKNKMELLQNR
jgi:hypothetical protein